MGAVGNVASAAGGAGSSLSWLGPAGMIAGGLLGGVSSIFNNERNLSAQADAQNYAKWLNERTWEREDSAVQRRVADLKRAGLSPVLAAGSSAQTGSPIKIDPQVSQDSWGAEGAISGVTRAAQTQQSIMAAQAAQSQIRLTEAQTSKVAADTLISLSEAGLYNTSGGHPKYQDPWGKRVTEVIDFLRKELKTDLRDVAAAKRDNPKELPWTPFWRVENKRQERTGVRPKGQ